MKVKTVFITLVLNIFAMMLATILLEYMSLSERIALVNTDVSTALETAINMSIKSEEFFTDVKSTGSSHMDLYGNGGSTPSTVLWNGSKFERVKAYDIANKFNTLGVNNGIKSIHGTGNYPLATDKEVYEWLYGGTSSDFNNTSLSWANGKSGSKDNHSSLTGTTTRGSINSNFQSYYTNVGQYVNTVGLVKYRPTTTATTYTVVYKTYPVLANMGLKLHSYNETTSRYTADNFSSGTKFGKTANNSVGTYYLTPASLGITYIPIEVVKPMFLVNLENICVLEKLSAGTDVVNISQTANAAFGCIPTSTYEGNTNLTHVTSKDNYMINNGAIEYDTSSVQIKVDYFIVDFSKLETRYDTVLGKIRNCTRAYFVSASNDSAINSGMYKESVTGIAQSTLDSIRNTRVVARVSVRLKLHIPYESALMQYLCKLQQDWGIDTTENHFGIKLYNTTNGLTVNNDDLWFMYTTYYMRSRT